MRQYEFTATHRTRGNVEQIRATARCAAVARWHIVNYYGNDYSISEEPTGNNEPHQVLGEIDATSHEHEKEATL